MQLPESMVYSISCKQFSEPLNDKEVSPQPSAELSSAWHRRFFMADAEARTLHKDLHWCAQMQEWVAMGHSPGFGSPHKSVKQQWQPWRVEQRQHDHETSATSLRTLGRQSDVSFKLDQVESITTDSPGNVALLLHPFRTLVVAVEALGVARVHTTRKPYTLKNAFHIASGVLLCEPHHRKKANSVISIVSCEAQERARQGA